MDLVSFTDRAPAAGETVQGREFRTFPGGKGGNQATAVGKLGHPARFVGCVGEDAFGQELRDSLRQAGVSVEYLKAVSEVSTGVAAITVEAGGENRIVVTPGANARVGAAYVEACARAGAFEGCTHLLLQLEIPLDGVEAAARLARQRGAVVILDPAPVPRGGLPPSLLANASILTPNESELAGLYAQLEGRAFTGGAAARGPGEPGPGAVAAMARRLLQEGVGHVVVKLGARGCLLVDRDGEQMIPGFTVQAVDTTGAGDAFNGGLAVALAKGYALPEACRIANAVGALSVTGAGAQGALPRWDQVEALTRTGGRGDA
ncbi:MAG: ribokinase [Firmicutes bacterium]|nr:ribokinase [Bacillota bacterium]